MNLFMEFLLHGGAKRTLGELRGSATSITKA
jgi:hypothetical protein